MNTTRRSLNQIEADLDRNREDMGTILDVLQQRLSTEDLFERSVNYLRSSGSREFLSNFRRSVTRSPVPLSLVGVGLVWLMLSGSDSARRAAAKNTPDIDAHELGSIASERTQSAARGLRDGAERAASSSRAGIQQLTQSARHGAASVSGGVRRGGGRMADGIDYMRREQPLVTAFLGLAAGAIVAASLPRTASENRTLGTVSDDFVTAAREAGEEKVDQARSVAGSAAEAASDAAKSEADRQGLRHSE